MHLAYSFSGPAVPGSLLTNQRAEPYDLLGNLCPEGSRAKSFILPHVTGEGEGSSKPSMEVSTVVHLAGPGLRVNRAMWGGGELLHRCDLKGKR